MEREKLTEWLRLRLITVSKKDCDWLAGEILASDWLRDTLAAERERCASYLDGQADYWERERAKWKHGTVSEIEVHLKVLRYRQDAQDIRNLAPKESDDARG